jgi:four helix bundle protein
VVNKIQISKDKKQLRTKISRVQINQTFKTGMKLVFGTVGSFLAAMTKIYDLEERTFRFANEVREFVKTLPNTCSNVEDTKQIIKSSGSVGANYIEANEALGKKDFLMRLRISRKEAKECAYFLRLIKESNDQTY